MQTRLPRGYSRVRDDKRRTNLRFRCSPGSCHLRHFHLHPFLALRHRPCNTNDLQAMLMMTYAGLRAHEVRLSQPQNRGALDSHLSPYQDTWAKNRLAEPQRRGHCSLSAPLAVGSGNFDPTIIAIVIAYMNMQYSSVGAIILWDVSQAYGAYSRFHLIPSFC